MLFKSDIKRITKSGLFDTEYYLQSYPDIKATRIDPLKHFVKHGWKEGRNPSERFDTNFYLSMYPDVAASGINPLVHYIKYGKKEGRQCHPSDPITFAPAKASKLNKLILLCKHAKNNPHLITRAVNEVRIYGIKKTIAKIKNKSHKLETSMTAAQGSTALKEILDLFHESPNIPNLKLTKPIDILIPVYNGKEFLIPLFESIFANTSLPYRLLVCDDKSSDETVLPLLHMVKNDNPDVNILILENSENLGFIKTVNKLAGLAENHFVLLNTDTEVPPFWMERLMYPIFSMDRIASTTPFTNAGTICSFPNYLEDNPIFENLSVEEIDRPFQYVNFESTCVKIPTGVGFCMGVNKKLVDNIGMFDEVFGKGYGEENDWCQRAIEQGYKNLHLTNLFVYHKHGGSFPSKEKKKLIQNNLVTLNKKHPSYDEHIQTLIGKNELSQLRDVLAYILKCSKYYSVLIFDHNLGGGANHYIDEKIADRVNASEVVCFIRYDFNVTKKYIVQLITKEKTIVSNATTLDELSELCNLLTFDEIFINSLVTYPKISQFVDLIHNLKYQMSTKVVIPIHDFFPVCPSYTLLDETMTYCGVPKNDQKCNHCLEKNKGEFKIFEKETDIRKWRNIWQKLFKQCDEIHCFSESSKTIFSKAYSDFDDKIQVIPHDISGRYQKIYDDTIRSDKIIIGVLGGINEAKGAKVIENLVKYIDEHKIDAKVVLIGQISIPIKSSSFEVTGRYEKQDLPQIVKKLKISKFLVPSIWPETFSYTTDEIMQMGYPLIVFDLGAPAERVKNYKLGNVIEIQKLSEVLFEKL